MLERQIEDKQTKDGRSMVFYITFLRALAACLITNAHYEGVYPTSILANGGLLGDVIFFAVSGYCLSNIKDSFPKWYGKRLLRCYLPVFMITTVYFLLGFYDFSMHGFAWWFIYPTNYHFVASIVLLYIPYYCILKNDFLKRNILGLMVGVGVVCLIVYLLFYDRAYYHIDTVREPMIVFLYMESMLLGAVFKENDAKWRNRGSWKFLIGLCVSFGVYFASKLLFSRRSSLCQYQIINWLTLLILLFFVFRFFCGVDGKLVALPNTVKKIVAFIAEMTLEIYVVQFVIIDFLSPLFGFPVNWCILTATIIVAAFILHYVCNAMLILFKREERLK